MVGDSSPVAPQPGVMTVGQLAQAVKNRLDSAFSRVEIIGEISNFRAYGSGHWYFTLKDRDAQLKAAMFAGNNRRVRFRPQDGDEVVVLGRVDLYTRRGDLQIIAGRMEKAGLGRLQAEFEQLKQRLHEEGLFDADRKLPLPAVPRRIGIVTSPQAAALQDMLRVLASRDPTLAITLAPTRVQGDGAGAEIAAALDLLNARSDVEVILCGRGGGSLEDLWAFNEEVVARAIARSRIPVVSGVGHEIDFTIADFVADARAPTPTAAAEMAVPIRAELEAATAALRSRLQSALRRSVDERRQRSRRLAARLVGPRRRLQQEAQRLDEIRERLRHALAARLRLARLTAGERRQRLLTAHPGRAIAADRRVLRGLSHRLDRAVVTELGRRREHLEAQRRAVVALGPLGSVSRGYSLTFGPDGALLRSAADAQPGEALRVRLSRGALDCTVDVVIDDPELDLRGERAP